MTSMNSSYFVCVQSSPEAEPVLNAEEFYQSVIVPHLSLHRPNHSVLGVRLALDLGTMLLGEILNRGKSNLDLTLSLVLAAEVLDSCSVLWCNDAEKVTLKQRLVAFLNQLLQFQKLETTFCGMGNLATKTRYRNSNTIFTEHVIWWTTPSSTIMMSLVYRLLIFVFWFQLIGLWRLPWSMTVLWGWPFYKSVCLKKNSMMFVIACAVTSFLQTRVSLT